MIQDYLEEIKRELFTGNAREHSYRPAFKNLIETLGHNINAVNEPSRSEYGAPDFIFFDRSNKDLIKGYTETKDINVDLDSVENSEQLLRYLGYSNLILTNYLEFRFFRNGEKYQTIVLADTEGLDLKVNEDQIVLLEHEIKAFLEGKPETITSAKKLSQIMGGKAARIRSNIINFLNEENEKNQELLKVYKIMQDLLVKDLTHEKFADMYAQTLVYGLFVARYYDETPETFNRSEARDLIPPSNPFLQHFFDHIAGLNFDPRLKYIVDELCDVFAVSAVQEIVAKKYNFLGEELDKDPIIHFYEDFLKEYDPKLRKQMGAYYTPVAVVKFIVRAVDEILEKDFGLLGLSDASMIDQTVFTQSTKSKKVVHRVQVLDPAVGTATFLNETIKFIFEKFKGQEGAWESYANNELLPRLYGFELMMAPYTIAHLKLGMTLKETGVSKFNKRLGVYLTNTLEEGVKVENTLFGLGFGEAIAEESEQANNIKTNKPIMVVMGNPPYSVSSSNKSRWIQNLIGDYKVGLNERKLNLDDDYIKFIRFTEYMINKNGNGIVAMITNNSFIDGITHRQMRKHLLETYDEIYILNLHGNSKKKEVSPDGTRDENVFDIQQGVSINILVKKENKKKKLGDVYYTDLYGKREYKFEELYMGSMSKIEWQKLNYSEPYYFFVPKDFHLEQEYSKGFRLTDLYEVYSAGIKTKVDSIATDFDKNALSKRVHEILTRKPTLDFIISEYGLKSNTTWEYEKAKIASFDGSKIRLFSYRPFDYRNIYYDHNFLSRSRRKVMENLLRPNLAMAFIHQGRNYGPEILASKEVVCEDFITNHTFVAPLFLYNEGGFKVPNLNSKIVKNLEKIVNSVVPEEVFDYIYAVLYSPRYREKYKEFLKIDFPRIPYPTDRKAFDNLAKLGKELRELHLLESTRLNSLITTFSQTGADVVENVEYKNGNIYINDVQYFGDVPEVAWNFWIGGYQPAQKWLKDRKGRKLTYEDINHYQKIIVSLVETDRIMKEIDKIDFIS